jgi:hypothetical protein
VFYYCQADWKNLHSGLTIGLSSILPENIDKNSSHSTTVDINMIWQWWRNCLLNAATRHIPTKVVRTHYNTPPWFDNKTCHSSKRKETARGKAKRTSKPCHWENFQNLFHSFKALVARKRKEFFHHNLIKIEVGGRRSFFNIFKINQNYSIHNSI